MPATFTLQRYRAQAGGAARNIRVSPARPSSGPPAPIRLRTNWGIHDNPLRVDDAIAEDARDLRGDFSRHQALDLGWHLDAHSLTSNDGQVSQSNRFPVYS
jgi:hypothetical protein